MGEAPLTDAVDQVAADLQRLQDRHAAELNGLLERQAGERAALIARLRDPPTASGVIVSDGAAAGGSDRRYVQGPCPPVWRHVSKLADHLGMSDGAAWDLARDAGAQWPYGKKARKVDITKFRDVLPDLENFDKL